MLTILNFRTLDLNLLRVFDVVMAERNLTRAAERLSITQPAFNNALKRLKDSVGEDLLTRVATGVRPTPAPKRCGRKCALHSATCVTRWPRTPSTRLRTRSTIAWR